MSFLNRLRAAGRAFKASAYDTTGPGRRARAIRAFGGGPNSTVAANVTTLRSQVRDARRNNWAADAAISAHQTNIVGTGIKPQFATSDSGLNRELAEMWLEWTDQSDADGVCDFYGQQALAVAAMAEAGDCFARMRVRRPTDGLAVPLQVQLLEADYVPAERTELVADGGRIVNGIRFNAIGQRTAYLMYQSHPAEISTFLGGNEARPVPASEVCHLYVPRRPGQLRGEPWLARMVAKLSDLDKYDDAEVLRKQLGSMRMGFRRRPVPDGASLEEIVEAWGNGRDDGDAVAISMEPGAVYDLEPGEEFQFTDPTDVGTQYEAFMRTQFRMLATAAGVLYEQMTGDYSQVNDRMWRAATNEFRRRVQMIQHHTVVFQFCRPVARRWLDLAVISGAIRPPRGMTERDLYRVRWMPQAWPYIHPVQDVQAHVAEIRAGLASRAGKVSERGDDVEQIDAEQQRDNERADEAGLSYDSDGRRAVTDPTKTAGAEEPTTQEA